MKKAALKTKLGKIKVLALDVDGVLTKGEIVIDSDGKEIKCFNVYDGFGIVLLRRAGFRTAIISARSAEAVTVRARDLGIEKIFQDARPKTKALHQLLKDFNVKKEEVCFVADDLPDICVLKEVGVAVSVPNARDEVKKIAHYVTENNGGQGAVREIVELIMKAQGKWKNTLANYN